MADVQLFNLRNRCHRTDIRQCKAVSGVNCEAELRAEAGGAHEGGERVSGAVVRIGASVELHRVSAGAVRRADCLEVRIDEETHSQARIAQLPHRVTHASRVTNDVEPALGSDLLAPFRNQRHLPWAETKGYIHHLAHTRRFEIEETGDLRCERLYVRVLHVAAVFAKMRGDSVGASRLTDRSRSNRIGLNATARLPQCRDMVDVDAEALVSCSHLSRPLGSLLIVENRVKKLVLALLVLSACSHATTTTTTDAGGARTTANNSQLVGGSTPRMAVEQFLTAVNAQDLQAMSVVFGTSHGPARDNMDRTELDKRLIILQCYFYHDKSRILGENAGEGGERVLNVELTRGRLTRTPRFYTIQGPNNRWFVDNMEIAVVREFCRDSGTLNQKH